MNDTEQQAEYCEEVACIRKVFSPYIYCDKHQDRASTPAVAHPVPTPVDGDLQAKIDKILMDAEGKYFSSQYDNQATESIRWPEKDALLQLFSAHLQATTRDTLIDLWMHKLEPALEESDTKIKVRDVIDAAINETRLKKEASK